MFLTARPALRRLAFSAPRQCRARTISTTTRTAGSRPQYYKVAAGTVAGALISGGLVHHLGQSKAQYNLDGGASAHASGPPIPQDEYGSPKDMQAFLAELRQILGEDAIDIDPEILRHHSFSEWSTVNSEGLPSGVVYPTSTEDVQAVMILCNKYQIPLIPFSGGSSLEGHFSTPHGGIILAFAHMDNIIQFNEADMDIIVQPGVSWIDLNNAIKSSGLFFPVDPGLTAKIGGMVGTNCSGTNAVRYGTMKDWVINMTVVMADGTVIKTRGRPRKSSAGYNLNGLFVGSEGTLGIVTEITLKLAVIPECTNVAVVPFSSITECVQVSSEVVRKGIPVAALELMDDVQMMVVNKAGGTKKKWTEAPTMFFKFSGTDSEVKEQIKRVEAIAKKYNSGKFEFARTKEDQDDLWSARKMSLWSMLAMRKSEDQDVWSTDVAVPISRLAELIEISKRELDELGMFASVLGHVGDGNFHFSIIWDKNKKGDRERIERVVHNMVERALEMEGTCTGEHGVGIGKKEYLAQELTPETINVMRKLKLALDPHWLLNPGKIFDRTDNKKEK